MNTQEVFTRVATHLLTQRECSTDGQEFVVQRAKSVCRYRGARGLRCAIGCLIEDRFYSPGMEKCGVGDGAVREALRKSGVDTGDIKDIEFLDCLQRVHDHHPVLSWRTQLHDIATRFGLRFPVGVP